MNKSCQILQTKEQTEGLDIELYLNFIIDISKSQKGTR